MGKGFCAICTRYTVFTVAGLNCRWENRTNLSSFSRFMIRQNGCFSDEMNEFWPYFPTWEQIDCKLHWAAICLTITVVSPLIPQLYWIFFRKKNNVIFRLFGFSKTLFFPSHHRTILRSHGNEAICYSWIARYHTNMRMLGIDMTMSPMIDILFQLFSFDRITWNVSITISSTHSAAHTNTVCECWSHIPDPH